MSLAQQHVMTAKQKTEHIKALAGKSREKFEAEEEKERRRQAWPMLRKVLFSLVNKHWFEMACGVVIMFNLVLVVVETDSSVDPEGGGAPFWVVASTKCLLVIYTAELTSKLYVYRLAFFKEMWNDLDFCIVGLDLVFLFIGLIVDQLPSVSILRVFKLLRLARAFKAAKSFRELNSLLRACTCALKAIFWGMILLCMALTVWGILAVQLIHPVNKEIAETKNLYADCERCPRAFSTVFDCVLTFWKQLVAGDSWGTLCEPIVEHSPWTFLFFVLVLVTVNLTMLNCILAVVVEAGAAATAADEHDQAMQREKMVFKAEGHLIDLCQGLDSDNSGSLNIQEFFEGYRNNDDFRQCLEIMHVTESDMCMIFNICDEDDSGDVDYREFVEQLRRIKHSGEQLLLHYVTDIRHMVNKIRPECLKAPVKTGEQEDNEEVKWDPSKEEIEPEVIDSTLHYDLQGGTLGGALPAALLENFAEGDALAEEIKTKEKDGDLGQIEREATRERDVLRMEKLERLFQINEELVTNMADVILQSKAQTGILNTLVGAFEQSFRSTKDEPSAPEERARSDPDVVQLPYHLSADPNTRRGIANILPSLPGPIGCCTAPPPRTSLAPTDVSGTGVRAA